MSQEDDNTVETPFPHLDDSTREALSLDIAGKIAYVKKEKWLWYPVAEGIEQRLLEIMQHPRTERMPCALIAGESDNGKSRLLKRFKKAHPPVQNKGEQSVRVPVVLLSAPGHADEQELMLNVVMAMGVPCNPNEKAKKLFGQAVRLLLTYKVQVLLIDEFNLLSVGTIKEQRLALNRLRLLSKEAEVSIVAAGTRQALALLAHESQFQNRFEPLALPRWHAQSADTLDLLWNIQMGLPLSEPSDLDGPEFAERIVAAGEGTIGGIVSVTEAMAVHAIKNQKPCLTSKMIADCGWIPFSRRAALVEKLL